MAGRQDLEHIVALVPLDCDASDPFASVRVASELAQPLGVGILAVIVSPKPDADVFAAANEAGATACVLAHSSAFDASISSAQLVAAFADVLSRDDVTGGPTVCVAVDVRGEELAARLSLRVDGSALGRCIAVEFGEDGVEARRSGFGGRGEIRIAASYDRPLFLTMRPTPASNAMPAAPVAEPKTIELGSVEPAASLQRVPLTEKSVDIETARVLVSGGRGMKGEDGFQMLKTLAECLGGEVSGSLPTADAGWIPVARQVGQSGRFVTPEIYLAVGISGTPQHMAGLGQATKIIAVNSDPDADVFRFTEIGVVAEWQEILPKVISALRDVGE